MMVLGMNIGMQHGSKKVSHMILNRRNFWEEGRQCNFSTIYHVFCNYLSYFGIFTLLQKIVMETNRYATKPLDARGNTKEGGNGRI